MAVTLAFDVYGTLIDTHGLVTALEKMIGAGAVEFSRIWREKQLEYSFRRGLMQKYENFALCTSQALEYTVAFCRVHLTRADQQELLEGYRTLPAFEDVQEGLDLLLAGDFRLFAFSNGRADAVEELLVGAGIRDFFLGVISVDDLQTFKPDPAVYSHFLKKTGGTGEHSWLISGNPFDVIGAISAGMRAAWVRRSPDSIFDPWGIEPTLTVKGLVELHEQLTGINDKTT